jgi:hypothetical protein
MEVRVTREGGRKARGRIVRLIRLIWYGLGIIAIAVILVNLLMH